MLEIGGADVRITEVAGCTTPRFAEPPMDCRFTVAGVPPKVVLDWIAGSFKRTEEPRNVGVVAVDLNLDKRQRAQLSAAVLTRVKLPNLNSAERDAVGLELTVRAAEISQETAAGKASPGPTSRNLFGSNFQAKLDGVPMNRVAEVRGLVVDITPPSFNEFEFTPGSVVPGVLTLSATPTDTLLRPWVADTVAGKSPRVLEVSLLDPTFTNVLLTWTTAETVPLGQASPFAVGPAGTTGRIELDAQGESVTID